jgi:hypothetical protein
MAMTTEDFYKAANLTDNPFRTNPAFASDPRAKIWVSYDQQKLQLIKYLQRSLCDQVGNANFLMMYGRYGTGKSHALLWAQNQVLHQQAATFNSVCYLIPTMKKAKGKLTFEGAFREDLMAKATLVSDVQGFHHFLVSAITTYKLNHNLDHTTLPEVIIEKLIPPVELHNFAKELYECKRREDYVALLAPKGLNDYQAMVIFTRLVNLFVKELDLGSGQKSRYKKAVYLFVDELDDLIAASAKEAREVNDILRHVYDSCPNCFCLVIALTADVSELATHFMDYILSRIQRQIELPVLDKDDAVDFVREILKGNRLAKIAKQGDFFPFTESAVESVAATLTEITPRKIVTVMQQVLEEVRLAGHDPSKDKPVDDVYLDQEEILEEVTGPGGVG